MLSVTFNPIVGPDANSAYNVPSGKDLYVPLTASDPGQSITYTASTTNSQVTATVLTGNPELVLNVSGTDSSGHAFSGALTFALFQNIAPQTVAAIIQDVANGIYTNSSFYRMETSPGFQIIQGGIEFDQTQPSATPAVVPNEYNTDIAFNSPGALAMATAQNGIGQKTGSTEIFVTAPNIPLAQEPQFLNYGYAIFGQLISDPNGVYSKIENVPTTSQGSVHYANTPVTITSASIVQNDTQNAVLQIAEPAGFTGNATVTVTANGTDNTSKQQAFNVNVVSASAGGAYVYLNPVSNLTTKAGQSVSFTVSATDLANRTPTFSVGDQNPFGQSPYPALANFTVTITPGANNTAVVTLTPKPGFTGTATIIMHADDTADGIADAQKFTVTVTGPLSVQTPSGQHVSQNQPLAIAGIALVDPGLPATNLVTTTLNVTHGTINVLTNVVNGITAGQITGNGTSTVTITAPLAATNATLAATNGLVYTPSASYAGADNLAITGSDTLGSTASGNVAISVFGSLLINVPGAPLATPMNTATVPSGLSISDPSLPSGNTVTLTLNALHGTIALATGGAGGITAAQVAGNGTATVVVTATLAQINTTLGYLTGGITYSPASGFSGTDTVTLSATDQLGSSSSNAFSILVGAAINAPSTLEAPSGVLFGINGISVADPAFPSADTVALTINAGHGIFKVATNVVGGVTNVTGNNSASVTLSGTLAQVNATLAAANGLRYRSALDYDGPDTLSLSFTDQLASTTNASVAVQVAGPLSVNLPGGAIIPAGTTTTITGVSIEDPGLPSSDNVTIALSAGQGTMIVGTAVSGGLTAAQVTGNGTGLVTITAPLATINATLAAAGGLTYTPFVGFAGNDTVTFSASDTAANSDTELTQLTILGPLSIAAPTSVQGAAPGVAFAIPQITVSDPGLNNVADITLVLQATHGTLNLLTNVPWGLSANEITGNGTSTVTITAPIYNINATLSATGGLTYTANQGFVGSDSLTFSANDMAGNSNTQQTLLSIIQPLSITTDIGLVHVVPGVSRVIAGISVDEPGLAPADKITFTLHVTNGTLNLDTGPGLPNGLTADEITGNGTNFVTIRATISQINSSFADGDLSYVAYPGSTGVDTLTLTATDQAGSTATGSIKIAGRLSVNAPVSQVVDAQQSSPISGVSITALSSLATTQLTVILGVRSGTLSVLPGVAGGVATSQITSNGTSGVIVTGTASEINATLAATNGLTYAPPGYYISGDEVAVTVTDHYGDFSKAEISLLQTQGISIHLPSTPLVLPNDITSAITGISLADPGLSESDKITVTIGVSAGWLDVATSITGGVTAAEVTGNGTPATITATLAQINATLAGGGLYYIPSALYSGNVTLGLIASDTFGNSDTEQFAFSVVGPVSVNILSNVLDALPGVATPITGLTITDPGLNPYSTDVTMTLSVSHGVLNVNSYYAGGLNSSEISGNGTNNVTVTATLFEINNTLSSFYGLTYTPDSSFSGRDYFYATVSDPPGNIATGVINLGTGIDVAAPASLQVIANLSQPISGISLQSADNPEYPYYVTLSAQHGSLTFSTEVPGGVLMNGIHGNGSSYVTVQGTLDQINATLAAANGLSYTPYTGYVGTDEIDVAASDIVQSTGSASISLSVIPQLSIVAPLGTLPVGGGTTPIAGISVVEQVASPLASVVTNFSVGHGSVTLSTTVAGGVTASQILGNGTGLVTVLAPLSAINATLADAHGLSYLPNNGDSATDKLSVTAEDSLQNTASADVGLSVAGPLSILGVPTSPIHVTPQGWQCLALSLSDPGLPLSNSVTVTLSALSGTITVPTSLYGALSSTQVSGNGTNRVMITAPVSVVNSALQNYGFSYQHSPVYLGPDTLTLVADDGVGNNSNASIAIDDVGRLTISVPTTISFISGGQTVPIWGVSVTYPGLPTQDKIRLDLGTSGGSLFLATNIPGGVTADEVAYLGGLNISITASLAQINTTLAAANGLSYKALQGFNGSDSIQFFASDAIATSNFANIPLQIASPPEVRKVAVDSTGWSQDFEQQFSSHIVNTTPGYILPAGQSQLANLPWSGLNEIRVQFTEDVNVQQGSLTVTGLNVPSYAISGFSYNSSSQVATWTLAQPIGADRVQIHLASSGPYAVTDMAGNPLDGEWTNGASAFPSGDEVAGGDFNFSFNVLPGDLNQDGIINAQDIALVSSNWMATPLSGFFDPAIDSNGDGIVNTQDLALISASWLKSLPAQATGNSLATGVSTALATGASQPALVPAPVTSVGEANPSTVEIPAAFVTVNAASEEAVSVANAIAVPPVTINRTSPAVESTVANMPQRPDVATIATFGSAVTTANTGPSSAPSGPASCAALAAVINLPNTSAVSDGGSSSLLTAGPAIASTTSVNGRAAAWEAALVDYATGADNLAPKFDSELATLLAAHHKKPLPR